MADEPQGSVTEEQDQPQPESPETTESGSQTETPATEADQASTDTTDWEQRYKDTQAAYTQNQQFLSALQGNLGPQVQAEAFSQLGYELPGEEPEDDEFLDETDRLRAELDEIKGALGQFQQGQTEAQETAQLEAHADQALNAIEQRENVQLTEEETQLILNHGFVNPGEDGLPDYEGAYKLLRNAQKLANERYVDSKKAPKVPVGGAAEEKIDTSDDNARQELMARIMAAEASE